MKRIDIPQKLIPKEYIGEKFGVLLVFVKGETQKEIDEKVQKIRDFALTLREIEKDNVRAFANKG